MENIFAGIVLGHLTGDYLLQNRQMALKKSERGAAGSVWCVIHCLVYTLSVCLFLFRFDPMLLVLIFLSHLPIDRWSLAGKWLRVIHGRDFIRAAESKDKYKEIDIAFSCFVYVAVDNTMHLILLWLIAKTI